MHTCLVDGLLGIGWIGMAARFFNKLGRAVNNAVIAADIYFGVVRSFRKLYMKKYSFNRR